MLYFFSAVLLKFLVYLIYMFVRLEGDYMYTICHIYIYWFDFNLACAHLYWNSQETMWYRLYYILSAWCNICMLVLWLWLLLLYIAEYTFHNIFLLVVSFCTWSNLFQSLNHTSWCHGCLVFCALVIFMGTILEHDQPVIHIFNFICLPKR